MARKRRAYTYRRRKRARPLARTIRKGYRILSMLNTLSVILTLDPLRITKHILRKGLLRRLSNMLH